MAPCEGCGRSFAHKYTVGLCKKCSLLSTLIDGSADFLNAQVRFPPKYVAFFRSEIHFLRPFDSARAAEELGSTSKVQPVMIVLKRRMSAVSASYMCHPPFEFSEPYADSTLDANGHSIKALSAQAIDTAKVARAHSMDVRMHHKRKDPLNVLNTTGGLIHARSNNTNNLSYNKINVHCEVRLKDGVRRTSTQTDPGYGKWGRPWSKDAYLSGNAPIL